MPDIFHALWFSPSLNLSIPSHASLSLPPSLSLFNSLPRSIDHIFVMLSLSLHGLCVLSPSLPLSHLFHTVPLSLHGPCYLPHSLSLSLHSLSYTHAPRERPGVLKGLWQGPVLGQGHQHTWFPLGQSQGPRELPSDGTPGQGEVGWLQEGKDKEIRVKCSRCRREEKCRRERWRINGVGGRGEETLVEEG